MKDYLRHIWYWICKYPLSLLPNNIFFNIQYNIVCLRHGYKHRWLNINNPRRFNEKIHWLKLNPCIKDGEFLADKYRVREYIKNTIYHNVNYNNLIVIIYRADFELIFVVV